VGFDRHPTPIDVGVVEYDVCIADIPRSSISGPAVLPTAESTRLASSITSTSTSSAIQVELGESMVRPCLPTHAPPSPSPLTWYCQPVDPGTHLYVWSFSHPLNGLVIDKKELHAQVERAFSVGVRFARNNIQSTFVYRTENRSIRGTSRAALIVDNNGDLQVAGFQSQEYNLSTSLAYKAGKRPPPQLEKDYVIVDEAPVWALHSDYDDATVYGETQDWFEKESKIMPGELAWWTGLQSTSRVNKGR
jgi:hypothetical protein